jgi:hypothetical protein
MAQQEIIKLGVKEAHTEDQLKRARRRINADSRKIGLSHWEWYLK